MATSFSMQWVTSKLCGDSYSNCYSNVFFLEKISNRSIAIVPTNTFSSMLFSKNLRSSSLSVEKTSNMSLLSYFKAIPTLQCYVIIESRGALIASPFQGTLC